MCSHALPPATSEVAASSLIFPFRSQQGFTCPLEMHEEQLISSGLSFGSSLMAESRNGDGGQRSPSPCLLVSMLTLFLESTWEQKGSWQHLSCTSFDVPFRTKSKGSVLMAEPAFQRSLFLEPFILLLCSRYWPSQTIGSLDSERKNTKWFF